MINIKTILLELSNDEAKIVNSNTIYLEKNESIKFKVLNILKAGDSLFYSVNKELTKMTDRTFVLNYDDIKQGVEVSITLKTEDSVYPKFYPIKDLKINDLKIIGETIDEKYPAIIQDLYSEIKDLKKAIINIYDTLSDKDKEGVIE